MRVYVAGKYKGHVKQNVLKACEAGLQLIKAGHDPFIPHLAYYIDGEVPEKIWKKWGLNWLSKCDAMIVISHSRGVEREIKRAKELDIPIFTLEEVIMTTTELIARMVDDCANENLFYPNCDCWRCPIERKCIDLWDDTVERVSETPRLKRKYLDEARVRFKEVFDEKHKVSGVREPAVE